MLSKYFPVIIAVGTSLLVTLIAVFIAVRAKRRREEYPYGGYEGSSRRVEYDSRYRQPRSYSSYPQSHESYPGARSSSKSSVALIFGILVALLIGGMLFAFFILRHV